MYLVWYTYLISITLTYALHRAGIRLTYWDISFRHGVQEVSITLPLFTANVGEELGLTWNSTFNSTESQWLFWHNIVLKCSLNPYNIIFITAIFYIRLIKHKNCSNEMFSPKNALANYFWNVLFYKIAVTKITVL